LNCLMFVLLRQVAIRNALFSFFLFKLLAKKENPTGWRLWGFHRDGNIDRFLKANALYGLLCLTCSFPDTKIGAFKMQYTG